MFTSTKEKPVSEDAQPTNFLGVLTTSGVQSHRVHRNKIKKPGHAFDGSHKDNTLAINWLFLWKMLVNLIWIIIELAATIIDQFSVKGYKFYGQTGSEGRLYLDFFGKNCSRCPPPGQVLRRSHFPSAHLCRLLSKGFGRWTIRTLSGEFNNRSG
jgi:hypothetical protein